MLTGSMRPGIAPGDLVVSAPVAPERVRPGQVVVVEDPARPGPLLVHRVVRRNADGTLTTKGDANSTEDPAAVPATGVRGLARLRVPKAGLPALWLREGRTLPVLGAFAALIALGWLARTTGRRPKHTAGRAGGHRTSGVRATRVATQRTRPAPR
ncbi:hypothetical protein GCM10009827_042160 [Dactylosporangium maewongense]|uniref:Signal peptidase I n=1 Tax=Dactylosporangium maewongense TaxID=634393 RepID=A0ABP4LE19_9ACTN